ncbi:MAG: acyl-CoA thioesterase [Spirochaetaceae bacterium]|jgi:acyl-CoA thioester hydrolase|nr:acyl-CoA thioesterase [Spirochaetaceae bacterium]
MKSVLSLRVRSYECDGYNHVNNAVYLHYLETARYEFLKNVGFDYKAMFAAGYGVYVARIEIEYKKPALIDEEIKIESWPVKKGAASGIIEQRITRGSDVIVAAKVTWVFVDRNGSPTKIPPEFDKPGLYPADSG